MAVIDVGILDEITFDALAENLQSRCQSDHLVEAVINLVPFVVPMR